MKLTALNDTCYYFDAVVNIGYVHHEEQGMLIDAGLDDSIMRKVLRELDKHDLPLTHLFITHAHVDHFGGANFLQKRRDVYTIAPILEEAILRNPILEPLYLFGGNDPLSELNNKFIHGKKVRVDKIVDEEEFQIGKFVCKTHLLPGHSYYQLGIEVDRILFAGDSYFSEEQLHKHKILYITNAHLTIESLNKLLAIECDGAVPGHGKFEFNFKETVNQNISYHENMLSTIYEVICSSRNGISHETVVAKICDLFAVKTTNLSQWLLYRTGITAYLVGLILRDKIRHEIEGNKWIFKKVD